MTHRSLAAALALLSMNCGGSSGTGTIPDIAAIAQKVVPQFPKSTAMTGAHPKPYSLTYNGAASDFTASLPFLNEVLGPDDGGVDTKIMIQLDRLRGLIDTVNATAFDSQGQATHCTTRLTPTSTVVTPFFSSSTPVFWASEVSDQGKYQCYVENGTSGGFVFGKAAIANPPALCSDANEYFIINGGNGQSNGGGTVYELQKIYYNGCTTQVGIAMSLGTTYPGNCPGGYDCEFDARFELWGTASTSTFQARILKLDLEAGGTVGGFPVGFGQFQGSGIATATGGSSSNLVFSYTRVSCMSAASCTATPDPAFLFCLTVGQSGGASTFSLDPTTADCAAYEANYSALTPLVLADVSRTNIDFSTTPSPFGF